MTHPPPDAAVDVMAWLARSQARRDPAPLMSHETLWDNGFLVRLFDGPTTPGRADYHINRVPELFLQLAGVLELRVWDGRAFIDHTIGPGELFSLPAEVPHRNRRPAGSVGLVVHVTRTPEQTDFIVWYCPQCEREGACTELHRSEFKVGVLKADLIRLIRRFLADEALRTCQTCGSVMPAEAGAM
ncbi:MAG: hypothetical protein AAF721_42450 [Myxococcota bacterium]